MGNVFELKRFGYVSVACTEDESESVRIAVQNLRQDLRRVLASNILEDHRALAKVADITNCNWATDEKSLAGAVGRIWIGTLGVTDWVGEIGLPTDKQGKARKEAYVIEVRGGELFIAGSDRRGTIYGIYEFSEKQLGVSPWYFFADVPIRQKLSVLLAKDYRMEDYPSIEYRGFFINDEEELDKWVQRYMGEETIGVKTYEKIFELILRLKLNYIWPAMHVNSFNVKRENGELAHRMGVVVGTSHCDMLMRSNHREWRPWLAKKGYTDVEYDFSVPGRNREVLKEYWRESVEQNQEFEVSYTLGMRGIHDSGFETRAFEGLEGKALLDAKIDLLDNVIRTQEEMLDELLPNGTLKIFVPYKEVLELYDNGLSVPEDLTLIWVNDNYGYVRRYPSEKEKKRKGGNGLYYHNSYWSPPGGSYLFICTIPMSQTRNELMKAYKEGIRKLWVTNFGALKPIEQEMSYYAAVCWNAGRELPEVEDEGLFLEHWIDRTFSGGYGRELSKILCDFDQITNVRKLEQMDVDTFSQSAYGDEAAGRLEAYRKMFDRGNEIWKALPKEEQDAFFQLVLMKIQAAYYTNMAYYYADRSNLNMKRGAYPAAADCTELSKTYDGLRRQMLHYYNHVMANGKWNGILTPEEFPPPKTALHPACMPPIGNEVPGEKTVVTLWNEEEKITFTKPKVKWIELAPTKREEKLFSVKAPEWIRFLDSGNASYLGSLKSEERILFEVDWSILHKKIESGELQPENGWVSDVILVKPEGEDRREIPVLAASKPMEEFTEDDGRICIEADEAKIKSGWKRIPRLGRLKGALTEAVEPGGELAFTFRLLNESAPLMEIHRFPSLNSVNDISVNVIVDEKDAILVTTPSNDEHRGTWKRNVRDHVDKLDVTLPVLSAGVHTIILKAVTPYFALSRLVLYTKERKENMLGVEWDAQRLPYHGESAYNAAQNALLSGEELYGFSASEVLPEPIYRLPFAGGGADSAAMLDQIYQPAADEPTVDAADLVGRGNSIFEEEEGRLLIECATALSESEFASTERAQWQYCNTPSHGRSGLAMYLRTPGLSFSAAKTPTGPMIDYSNPLAVGDDRIDGNAPALRYRVKLSGGSYHVWVKVHMWGMETSHFAMAVDEKVYSEREIYGGGTLWKYPNEQTWKWLQLADMEISEGEHDLRFIALCSLLRVEGIYLTKDEELPR